MHRPETKIEKEEVCGSMNIGKISEILLEESKLVQHAYKEGHRVGWDEASILEIESNSRYRKYTELAYVAYSI
jgi:hypothetical protein